MITAFTVGCSRTINLGNFESMRLEASITVDLQDADVRDYQVAKDNAQQELRKLLEETYRKQYAEKKKIA